MANSPVETFLEQVADLYEGVEQLLAGKVEVVAVIDDGFARMFGTGIDLDCMRVGPLFGLTFDVEDYEYDAFADMNDYDEEDEDEDGDSDFSPTCEKCGNHVHYGFTCGMMNSMLCPACVYVVDTRQKSWTYHY